MKLANVIDLEILTTPISTDNPAGVNIRTEEHSSLYHRLKDARFAARAQERQSVQTNVVDKKFWDEVLNLSIQVLQTLSKDLEVCAWLIEALVRKHGYIGFRDGYKLVNELIKTLWDHLYPKPDEDGFLIRIAALTGLNGQEKDGSLISPLSNISFVETKYGSFSLWQYKQALNIENISDLQKKEQQQQIWQISLDKFKTAIQQSSVDFLKNLMESLQQCIEEYNRFDALMTEKCSQDSPPTSNVHRVLHESLEALESLTKDMFQNSIDEGFADDSSLINNINHSSETQNISRETAFKSLLNLADFFKRTEPHSPISYILARAVRWGQLSLPDLIAELIKDDSAHAEYCLLAGIDVSSNDNK